jgi:small GTP-binding protein
MTEINLKLILIGDSEVGKSTILLNYTDNIFCEEMIATICLENKVKTINIRGLKAKLQIWDTAGQEKFSSLTKGFFRNTDGILLVFDLTNNKSFNNIKKWINEVENNSDNKTKKILVGNKVDKKDNIQVSKIDIDNLCKKKKIKYIEVSGKNNTNVNEAFDTLVNLIIDKKTNEELIADYGITDQTLSLSSSAINNTTGEKKKKCCP